MLAIDVRPNETAAQIKAYAAQNGLKHVLLVDGNRVANQWGVTATPTTFYFNPQGTIASGVRGLEELSDIESRIASLLPKGG